MGGWSDLGKSILRGTLNREKVEIATEIKRGVQGVVGEATGGLVGTQPAGQETGRPGARPQSPPAAGATGVNAATQGLLDRFGNKGQQQAPGLMDTLTSIPGRLLGTVLPSEQTTNRLRNGAAAIAATVSTVAATGTALVQEGVDAARAATTATAQAPAPVEDRSTYSAAAIAEARAQGRDTSGMKETPPMPPTKAEIEAAAAQQRPVVAAQEAAKPFVLVTEEEHKADLAAQAAAPASTVSTAPAVATPVKPTAEFAVAATATAAAPAKPSVTANLDSMIDNEKDASRLETLTRARAQIQANYGGPSNG